MRIGLCWAGAATHPRDAQRSMPFDAMRPLLDMLPDAEWLNFCFGPRGQVDEPRLIPVEIPGGDYLDSARVLATCDLLITVDTSVLHLAGALGVPVWALVSTLPDARWGLEIETSEWYETLRLFRQEQPFAWAPVIERVSAALRLFVAQRISPELFDQVGA